MVHGYRASDGDAHEVRVMAAAPRPLPSRRIATECRCDQRRARPVADALRGVRLSSQPRKRSPSPALRRTSLITTAKTITGAAAEHGRSDDRLQQVPDEVGLPHVIVLCHLHRLTSSVTTSLTASPREVTTEPRWSLDMRGHASGLSGSSEHLGDGVGSDRRAVLLSDLSAQP